MFQVPRPALPRLSAHALVVAFLAAILMPMAASQAPAEPPATDTITAQVDALLAENDIPGAMVLVEQDGRRTLIARGTANTETGLAMATDQQMRIASVGKLHTAAVIHQLLLASQLDLDTPLARLVEPRWIDGIANADRATVRQLLNHTSGIPDYYDDTWFAEVDTVHGNTPDRTLAHIRGVPAEFEPGAAHAYSNTNYQYLALVAEAVTGETLDRLYQRLVFAPAGLAQTGYNTQFAPGDVIHGYGSERDPEEDAYALIENNGPDGGIFTTASDLADFLAALFGPDGALNAVGASMLSDRFDRGDGRYRALGPAYVEHPLGFTAVTHGGSIAGYATIAIRGVSEDFTVIVHLNRDRPDLAGALARDLTLEMLGEDDSASD